MNCRRTVNVHSIVRPSLFSAASFSIPQAHVRPPQPLPPLGRPRVRLGPFLPVPLHLVRALCRASPGLHNAIDGHNDGAERLCGGPEAARTGKSPGRPVVKYTKCEIHAEIYSADGTVEVIDVQLQPFPFPPPSPASLIRSAWAPPSSTPSCPH